MSEMKELKELMLGNGFDIDEEICDGSGNIETLYFNLGGIVVSIVGRHSGNSNKLLVRADISKRFERWGNTIYESILEDLEQFKTETIFTLLGLVYAENLQMESIKSLEYEIYNV